MLNIFPAVERRFNADNGCVEFCRQLYEALPDGDSAPSPPKPYATWTETNRTPVDTFDHDIDIIDVDVVLFSGSGVTTESLHTMIDNFTRAFDKAKFDGGDFARIVSNRVPGPFTQEYLDGAYTATLTYQVIAQLASLHPAVRAG